MKEGLIEPNKASPNMLVLASSFRWLFKHAANCPYCQLPILAILAILATGNWQLPILAILTILATGNWQLATAHLQV